MSDDGPRMTRGTSKRGLAHLEADDDNTDDRPPPMKSGLTEIMGGAGLEEGSPVKGGRRGSTGTGGAGLNDKKQQKKWANKRDVRRSPPPSVQRLA